MKLGISVLPLCLAAAFLPACDSESEPDDGATMDMLSEDGPMGDRDLEWQNAGDVPIEGMEHAGVAEVVAMTDSRARVTSERIVIGPLGDRLVEAVIDPVGFEAGDERAVAFALFTREGADHPWESYSLPGTVGEFRVDARMFHSIRINRELNSMELEVALASPDGVWTDHFAKVVRLDPSVEIALAPLPLASWDSLEGTWEFDLQVRCDGGAC